MKDMAELIGEQAKMLLENDSWLREKLESFSTEKERCEFLAVAAMYAMAKANR